MYGSFLHESPGLVDSEQMTMDRVSDESLPLYRKLRLLHAWTSTIPSMRVTFEIDLDEYLIKLANIALVYAIN